MTVPTVIPAVGIVLDESVEVRTGKNEVTGALEYVVEGRGLRRRGWVSDAQLRINSRITDGAVELVVTTTEGRNVFSFYANAWRTLDEFFTDRGLPQPQRDR